MRLLFVSALFCLTLSFYTAQAQTTCSNGDHPKVSSRAGFVLSSIDETMVKRFNGAWQQAALGTKDTEAVVLVMRKADGSVKAVSGGRTNQAYEFTFIWDPAIVAIIHTHPNDRDPKPVEQDILVARRFDVPIFTLSRQGMFMYDPATDRITKIKSGTDWLESSSWVTNTHLAATEPSNR
ncbi:MAG: hypothetical protein ACRD2L_23885 [Terriglobia bacterium]